MWGGGEGENKSFTDPPIHPRLPSFSKHVSNRYHVPGPELSTRDMKTKSNNSNNTWTMPSSCSPFSEGDRNTNRLLQYSMMSAM